MKRTVVVWVWLAAWLSSCANQPAPRYVPAGPASASRPVVHAASRLVRKPASRPAASMPSDWVTLFDGSGMQRWAVVQGKADCRDGAIRMAAGGNDVTLLANGVDLRDGVLEVTLRRRDSQLLTGPLTIGLRLVMQWNWSSLYFVCRPDQVEVCRGTSLVRFPAPEYIAQFLPEQGVEVWRFEMQDGRVVAFRNGQKVITYADSQPAAGSITLTASHCDVDVLAVRYKPAQSDLRRLATRPAIVFRFGASRPSSRPASQPATKPK